VWAVIAAVRIPQFKNGKWRDCNVEVALATGVLGEVQCQILIALLKDRIIGSARKRHAELCLMPKIRAHRHQPASVDPLSQPQNSVAVSSFPLAQVKT
jgi:hypothetical protein